MAVFFFYFCGIYLWVYGKLSEYETEGNKKMDKKQKLLDLIDKAGKGSIEAAEQIAVGYFKGEFGEKNLAKARKWASYAAKHGSKVAENLLKEL